MKLTQDLFQKIRKIQFESKKVSDHLIAGAWRSVFKGQGIEFNEVRDYQPGDDIRHIDWNVTARMDHPYVKVFQEERELTVMLLVDISASSLYGSTPQIKRELITEIGATLAFSALKNNDQVGLVLFSDKIEKYIPPKKGTRHVLHIIRQLLAFEPTGTKTDLACALNFFGTIQHRSSITFLISDFITPLYPREMAILAKKHDLIAISVTDPTEVNFPEIGLVTIKDLESDQEFIIDSFINTSTLSSQDAILAKDNSQNTSDEVPEKVMHLDKIKNLMKQIGGAYIDIRTNIPYLPEIEKFFKLRVKGGL